MHLLAWVLSAILTISHVFRGGSPPPLPPAVEEPPLVVRGADGWIDDPDAVNLALPRIAAQQGMPAEFRQIAQATIDAPDDDRSVFFWHAEKKVLDRILPSWNQNPAGTCVSMGWARGCQDLMLLRIASGEREQWHAEVATEPIYGFSRVEIGGGRIRGDGSVGAWAAQAVQKYGLLFRQEYADGRFDLRTYSVSTSRAWGKSGVPNELEPIAREHPVTTVARLSSGAELWAAMGSGYPVPVCSDVGFEGRAPSDGIMDPRGEWAHCMLFRGRFVHPTKGKCVIVQNSWGNYLGRVSVETADHGRVELPEGCFAIRLAVAERMVKQGDTFAISSLRGFPKRRLTWDDVTINRPMKKPGRDQLAAFDLTR